MLRFFRESAPGWRPIAVLRKTTVRVINGLFSDLRVYELKHRSAFERSPRRPHMVAKRRLAAMRKPFSNKTSETSGFTDASQKQPLARLAARPIETAAKRLTTSSRRRRNEPSSPSPYANRRPPVQKQPPTRPLYRPTRPELGSRPTPARTIFALRARRLRGARRFRGPWYAGGLRGSRCARGGGHARGGCRLSPAAGAFVRLGIDLGPALRAFHGACVYCRWSEAHR